MGHEVERGTLSSALNPLLSNSHGFRNVLTTSVGWLLDKVRDDCVYVTGYEEQPVERSYFLTGIYKARGMMKPPYNFFDNYELKNQCAKPGLGKTFEGPFLTNQKIFLYNLSMLLSRVGGEPFVGTSV